MKLGKLLVGLGIGTVIGMLIAPKKGSELVEDINAKVKDAKEAAKELNETTASVQKAIKEFDKEEFKETTKVKLENLGTKISDLKEKVVESDQFNKMVGTFNNIANTVNDKVEEIIDELELEEINEEIEEEIDDTAKEIEELIQEMNADSEDSK